MAAEPLEAQQHSLVVPRTARYFQLGNLATAKRLWVVCHGYGQLASFFVRHFRVVLEQAPDTAVVAPEGLSRFYLQGTSGRVGATWMTREDRLSEIEDYSAYLDLLLSQLVAACPPGVEVTLLGFSQGASTLSRWLMRSAFTPARLVLWAGAFPEDVEPATAQALFRRLPQLSYVCGDADEYITEARLQAQLAHLAQLGASPRVLRFVGGHQLDAAVLRQLTQEPDPR
ncbi:alpha/beta hydrolase [Hymenobacter latericus]|uniref:alpha/beta hydrolase n=1 Tax=Hymenobacter sp. YIM 151858-1 TaxID=2987688 RepID=UPI002225FA81|nr:phospholipase [Hymenobacter sp. YIM 151858-1]UYZ60447.1 phospholipase [Hymenobacter sp. YIM 151858-1]